MNTFQTEISALVVLILAAVVYLVGRHPGLFDAVMKFLLDTH